MPQPEPKVTDFVPPEKRIAVRAGHIDNICSDQPMNYGILITLLGHIIDLSSVPFHFRQTPSASPAPSYKSTQESINPQSLDGNGEEHQTSAPIYTRLSVEETTRLTIAISNRLQFLKSLPPYGVANILEHTWSLITTNPLGTPGHRSWPPPNQTGTTKNVDEILIPLERAIENALFTPPRTEPDRDVIYTLARHHIGIFLSQPFPNPQARLTEYLSRVIAFFKSKTPPEPPVIFTVLSTSFQILLLLAISAKVRDAADLAISFMFLLQAASTLKVQLDRSNAHELLFDAFLGCMDRERSKCDTGDAARLVMALGVPKFESKRDVAGAVANLEKMAGAVGEVCVRAAAGADLQGMMDLGEYFVRLLLGRKKVLGEKEDCDAEWLWDLAENVQNAIVDAMILRGAEMVPEDLIRALRTAEGVANVLTGVKRTKREETEVRMSPFIDMDGNVDGSVVDGDGSMLDGNGEKLQNELDGTFGVRGEVDG